MDDVKWLCEDMMNRSRDPKCGFRDASFLERAATALTSLSRELAEARAVNRALQGGIVDQPPMTRPVAPVIADYIEVQEHSRAMEARALAAEAASLAKDERIAALEAALDLYRDAVRIDVKMEGPKFMGSNTSALKRAWEADYARSTKEQP